MMIDAMQNNLHAKSHLHPCAKAYEVFFHRKLPSPARDSRPGSLARHRNTTPSGSEAPPRLLPPSKTPQTSGVVGTVIVGSGNPLRLRRSLRAVCHHRRRVQCPDVRLQRDACPLAVHYSFLGRGQDDFVAGGRRGARNAHRGRWSRLPRTHLLPPR